MKKYRAFIIAAALALLLTACSVDRAPNTVRDIGELDGKTVGVISGGLSENFLADMGYNVTIKEYEDASALASAVLTAEVDCAVAEGRTADRLAERSGLSTLEEPLVDGRYRIAVSRENTELQKNVESALSALASSGQLGEMIDGWMTGGYEYGGGQEYEKSLAIAVDPTLAPFGSYGEDGSVVGAEIDIARAVCGYLGVAAEIMPVPREDMLYMVESGKVSLAIGRLTEEAAGEREIRFSGVYMTVTQKIVVRED